MALIVHLANNTSNIPVNPVQQIIHPISEIVTFLYAYLQIAYLALILPAVPHVKLATMALLVTHVSKDIIQFLRNVYHALYPVHHVYHQQIAHIIVKEDL